MGCGTETAGGASANEKFFESYASAHVAYTEDSASMEIKLDEFTSFMLFHALDVTAKYTSGSSGSGGSSPSYSKQVSDHPLFSCTSGLIELCTLEGPAVASAAGLTMAFDEASSLLIRDAVQDISGTSAWTTSTGNMTLDCEADSCVANVGAVSEYWVDANNALFDEGRVHAVLSTDDADTLYAQLGGVDEAIRVDAGNTRVYCAPHDEGAYCSLAIETLDRELQAPFNIEETLVGDSALAMAEGLGQGGHAPSFTTDDGLLSLACDDAAEVCKVNITR